MTENNLLSAREQEILRLVATGLTNREIAQALTISPNTVKVHLSNIFEKTGVASRTEAAMYGMEHGIVDKPGGEEVTVVERYPLRETIKKYRWVFVAMFLLLVVLGVTFTMNVLLPALNPETTVLEDVAERWKELAPMPEPRAAMAAVAYDGMIYTIAGESPEGVEEEVFRYDPENDRWTQLSDKPTPVADVHGALIGEQIYVPGGRLASGEPTDILEIYDPRQDAWIQGAPLPMAISAYALADFEGKLYLFGGWDGEQALADVYVYDPGEDAWREGTEMDTARFDAFATEVDGKIFVFGGRNDERDFRENMSVSPMRMESDQNPWMVEEPLPINVFGMSAVNLADKIYVFNGSSLDETSIDQMYFSISENKWYVVNQAIKTDQPIAHSAAVSMGEYIFLIGGEMADSIINRNISYRAIYTIMLPFTINQ